MSLIDAIAQEKSISLEKDFMKDFIKDKDININIRDIKQKIYETEKLIAKNNNSGDYLKYFSLLSKYYYLGGKTSLINMLKNSVILSNKPLDNKGYVIRFLGETQMYVFGGQLKLRLHKIFDKANADLFGIDRRIIQKAVNKLKEFTYKYGIALEYNYNNNELIVTNMDINNTICKTLNNWDNINMKHHSNTDMLENIICDTIINAKFMGMGSSLGNDYYTMVIRID